MSLHINISIINSNFIEYKYIALNIKYFSLNTDIFHLIQIYFTEDKYAF